MGSIISGIIGGVGSIAGANKGAKQSLTGYNYLTGTQGTQSYVDTGKQAQQNEAGTVANESALLGGGTPAAQAAQKSAFNNYLNSTGYQFQLGQGQQAITGSAAARGLLGSGATAKALTQFGQGLAGQYFNNYMGQLSNVAGQQANIAGQGLTAAGQIGQAGTQGGSNAGNISQSGISSAGSQFGNALGGIFQML